MRRLLETDGVKSSEMKEKRQKENTKQVQKVLNGLNYFTAINSGVVAAIRYNVGLTDWQKDKF